MEFDLNDLSPFTTWFPGAALNYLVVLVILAVVIFILGWCITAIRNGPIKAFHLMGKLLSGGVGDLLKISPRRIAALTWLAVKESIRRRVLVVIFVFGLVLLFAGWFLDPDSSNPAQLYLSFVLTATSYLVLLLTLILCSLSLPADLKNRTLHTIVTKPVRSSEIILGRIFGFAIIGTMLLLVMGVVSFFFVERGLAHKHSFDPVNLRPAEGAEPDQPLQTARTGQSQKHSHVVMVDSDGTASVEMNRGHTHSLEVVKTGDKEKISGPAEGELIARVPIFGTISFLNRAGLPEKKGISVGKENTYRSYIEGGSQMAAIWKFQGVTEDRFPEGLPVALCISVFRSYTGTIEKGIPGSLWLLDPQTKKWVSANVVFSAKDYMIDLQTISREVIAPDGRKLDVFKDFAPNGELSLQLRCEAPAQYFGVAQPDLYLRTPDAPFFLNFFKGYLGIWLQMMLLTSLGVFFSTFLSGPVAMLSTAGMMVGGLCHRLIFELATGFMSDGTPLYGGGPFESLVRIFTQENIVSEMNPGLRTTVVKSLDMVFQQVLYAVAMILPDFGHFSFADYVASGFNVPGDLLLKYICRAAAFVIPVFVASYFCFKMREVAK